MSKVRILVAYHKRDTLYRNELLVPIHCGRALLPPGHEDRAWLLENLLGDDTGDNISALNRDFCELTGLYWAWKNYDRLGAPDFIGLAHYRRLWYLADDFPAAPGSVLDQIALTEANVHELLARHPVLLTRIYQDHTLTFREFQRHIRLTPERHPTLYQGFLDFERDKRYYFCNMFVLPRELFFDYCRILFEVLFAARAHVEQTGQTVFPRFYGFAAEYLTSFHLMHLLATRQLPAKELPVVYLDPPRTLKL